MAEPLIQVPAIFTGFGSRSDGGATLRFATQELNETDFALLKQFHQTYGHLLFRKNAFTAADVPKEDASDGRKSQSRRIRDVLFVYWKQKGEKQDFETFYRQQTDKFINLIRDAID